MPNDFTSWDSYDELYHHGIKGMKWYVRRFQNEDGSLTEAGKARYGTSGFGGSAKTMTKHLNALDRGYANLEARRRVAASKASKLSLKSNKAMAKGHTEKATRLRQKAIKYGMKAGQANKQKQAVESLQYRIIGAAVKKGYTINSKPVERIGRDGKTRVAALLAGAPGVALYSSIKKGKNIARVSGQQFSISRKGDGRSSIVNYRAANSSATKAAEALERNKAVLAKSRGRR